MRKKIIAVLMAACIFAVSLGLHTIFATVAEEPQIHISAKITNSLDGFAIGTQPSFVSISDLGWRNGTTAATATISRKSSAHGSQKTLVLDSEVAEGQGPTNGTPCYGLNTNITVDPETDTFMMYIKLPKIGTYSLDPWPPKTWSVSFNAIQIKQDSTGQAGLRAHGWNSGFGGWKIDFLDINSKGWTSFEMDGNGRITLPGGSEGYLKINMSKCPLFNNWVAGGLNANAEYTVDYLEFVFGWLGGEYGSFDIGAFYTVTDDNDSVMLQLDTDTTPTAMINTVNFIEATLRADVSDKEIGSAVDSSVVSISDLGWRPGTTQATATIGEAKTPVSDNKSIVVSSPVAEGETPNNATPLVSVSTYTKINPSNHAFMMYIETPTYDSSTSWAVRVNGMSYQQEGLQSWFYSNFNNANYSYLAVDGEEWVEATTDTYSTLALPSGFKGYVKMYLDTAQSWYSAEGFNRNNEYQLNAIDFVFKSIGGEYGDFVIGGIYQVDRDCNAITMSLNGGEETAMTVYVDRMEATVKYDNIGDAYGLITINDLGYRPGKTQATASLGASVSPLSNVQALVIDSAEAEGEGPNYATPAVQFAPWSTIKAESNVFMLYIETPTLPADATVGWTVRLKECSLQQAGANGWFGSDFANTEYAFLASNGNAWTKSKTDDFGTLKLPSGFKGYLKIYFDTCPHYSNWEKSVGFNPAKDYIINYLTFIFGWLGGEHGQFVIGDTFEVTKDSDATKIKISGGPLTNMTSYEEDNLALLQRFERLIDSIGEIDLGDAAAIDEASAILAQIDPAYAENISIADKLIYDTVSAKVNVYRPSFLGVTIKSPASATQAMKFGAAADIATAKTEGYEITGYGMVSILEDDYNGTSLINAETPKAVVLNGTLQTQTDSSLSFTGVYDVSEFKNYGKKVITRAYVTYYNSDTNQEYTVFNGVYEYKDGSTDQSFKCSVMDAALYFGVSVMGN
ncbi:MAG: hypothetical protein E7562_00150 [Ruminococcaceae bacterium]|nr:hypothetical protein [Oscillospiraceae bacterium]